MPWSPKPSKRRGARICTVLWPWQTVSHPRSPLASRPPGIGRVEAGLSSAPGRNELTSAPPGNHAKARAPACLARLGRSWRSSWKAGPPPGGPAEDRPGKVPEVPGGAARNGLPCAGTRPHLHLTLLRPPSSSFFLLFQSSQGWFFCLLYRRFVPIPFQNATSVGGVLTSELYFFGPEMAEMASN